MQLVPATNRVLSYAQAVLSPPDGHGAVVMFEAANMFEATPTAAAALSASSRAACASASAPACVTTMAEVRALAAAPTPADARLGAPAIAPAVSFVSASDWLGSRYEVPEEVDTTNDEADDEVGSALAIHISFYPPCKV